jgi:adenylate kinase family enzyme
MRLSTLCGLRRDQEQLALASYPRTLEQLKFLRYLQYLLIYDITYVENREKTWKCTVRKIIQSRFFEFFLLQFLHNDALLCFNTKRIKISLLHVSKSVQKRFLNEKNLSIYNMNRKKFSKFFNFILTVHSVRGALGDWNLTPIWAYSSPPKISRLGRRCTGL